MTTDTRLAANKAAVRQLYQLINENRPEDLPSLIDPDFADRSNGRRGPEGMAEAVANLHRAYADLNIEIVEMLAEGDLVVIRWFETGRHVGPFFNLRPTGKPFEARGLNFYRFANGRIVESWLGIDPGTIRAQQAGQEALANEAQAA